MLDEAIYALLMVQGGLEFVSSAATAPSSSGAPATKPSGVEVGDLVFVWALDCGSGVTLTTSGGSAWTNQDVAITAGSTNSNASLFWKFLDATDVANAWDFSGGFRHGATAIRYRANGADTVTVKATQSNGVGGTTLTLTGFAKAAGHFAALAFFGAPSSTGVSGITVPGEFTERVRSSGAGISGTYGTIIADAPGNYTDGSAVTFSNCDGAAAEYGILVEVTGP